MRLLLLLAVSVAASSCAVTPKFEKDPIVPQTSYESEELPVDAIPFRSMGIAPAARAPAGERLALPPGYKSGEIFSTITDPVWLQALEARGFGLARHFGGSGNQLINNKEFFAGSAQYGSIVNVIDADLQELQASERRFDANTGVGMNFTRRIFDINWLKSQIADYQLIGVINRLDRVAFDADTCGELRFIYRLAYEHPTATSRMPFTMLVKYVVEKKGDDWDSCKRMVSGWKYPDVGNDPARLLEWLVSEQGPLASEFTRPQQLHSIEVNMQALRIPSTVRSDIGSHAEYLLRVFKLKNGVFTPALLENTPDVEKIKADANLMREFKALMKDRHVARRIDHGIFVLDDKFLATKAFSYSPMGLERLDNKLYSKLLSPADFDPAHFTARNRFVRTPDAAIRRLNDLSCVGCHQGRATAGFHFLGIDRPETHAMNALKYEGSGHFQLELLRRKSYLERVASNLVPDPGRDFSYAPPTKSDSEQSLTPDYAEAGINHFCGLPGSKAFATWKCAANLKCVKYEGVAGDNELGKCMSMKMPAGSACQSGVMTQADHHTDTLKLDANQRSCGAGRDGYRCSALKGGFPSGSCSRPCTGLLAEFEVCGSAPGPNFSACLARKTAIDICYADAIASGRGKCNDSLTCRNDYVCERAKSGPNGYCTPTYSMGQIRLDGHPSP